MTILFLVPARAGSKRLPGKNHRAFCGLPLYLWSIATAERVNGGEGLVYVATDDRNILNHPASLKRPPLTATDDAPTQALIDWAMDFLSVDTVCLLQPTSPTRSDSLVRSMIARGDACRSVTNGLPNGQCWVFRKGVTGWTDIETEKGHDIDTLADFEAAEADMMRRFA